MEKKKRNVSWYIIKIFEFILVLVCILLLVLNESIYTVFDDFTPAYTKPKNSTNSSSGKDNATLSPLLLSDRQDDHVVLRRVKREEDDNTKKNTQLSHLLVLYPSCTTILIIFTMDVIGQILRNPLSKGSAIVLLLLCDALSVVILSVSLISALHTIFVPMILVAVASAVLVIIVTIDLVLESLT